MAIRTRTSADTIARSLSVGVMISFACVSIGTSIAGTGEWSTAPGSKAQPTRNMRLRQQPLPPSAPVSAVGNAVELTGTIESWPAARQPRPVSAAPKRLDALISTLGAESP